MRLQDVKSSGAVVKATARVLTLDHIYHALSLLVRTKKISSEEADRVWASIKDLTTGSAMKVLGESQLVSEIKRILDDRQEVSALRREPQVEPPSN